MSFFSHCVFWTLPLLPLQSVKDAGKQLKERVIFVICIEKEKDEWEDGGKMK